MLIYWCAGVLVFRYTHTCRCVRECTYVCLRGCGYVLELALVLVDVHTSAGVCARARVREGACQWVCVGTFVSVHICRG